jgi:superfamily II DNA or RNA helicase
MSSEIDSWVPINRKEFGEWVQKTFKFKQNDSLFAHQRLVTAYLKDSPYRGLLLYHGLGVGKTRSAISICEAIGNNVIVLLPASIEDNFESEKNTFAKNTTLKYEYIHYNGLTQQMLSKLPEDRFDKKTIVIDEVHNFVSMVKNGSKLASRLYNMIINCKDAKVVLLSGTPILNSPDELLYIFNLIYGSIYRYVLTDKNNAQDTLTKLEKNMSIASSRLRDDQKTIDIFFNPKNFVFEDSDKTRLVKGKTIKPEGIKISKDAEYLLPRQRKDFKEKFLEKEGCKNLELFSRRIQGLVSYYEFYNTEDYPTLKNLMVVYCPMTDDQFKVYSEMRAIEVEREMKSKRKSSKDESDIFEDNGTNLYRCYTRACCNFVFPREIERPFGSLKKMLNKELDDDEYDYNDVDDNVEYDKEDKQAAIKAALKKLNTSKYLKDELDRYSPKMYSIMNSINKNKGNTLVYTSFRNVEGVKVFSMVMEQHGFLELSIKTVQGKRILTNAQSSKPKYIVFASNRDNNNILMNIFNNNIDKVPTDIRSQLPEDFDNLRGEYAKVIIITKSGSEGISLKNVRYVHIMEPYWNDIRIRQVIGRAVRAGSHKDLPPEERTVKPYIYLMQCVGQQLLNKTVALDRMTTDEYIYDIATKKTKINNIFLNILKETSIDCRVNKLEKCKTLLHDAKGNTYPFGSIDNDIEDHMMKMTRVTTKFTFKAFMKDGKPVKKDGKALYFHEKDPSKLYYKKTLEERKNDPKKPLKPDALSSDYV